MKVLVTGGAGFIGSTLIRKLIENKDHVINVDKLTYAGNLNSLESVVNNPLYEFEQIDICDKPELDRLISQYRPEKIIHLAAESHVDRSIGDPGDFMDTNILGTYQLLQASRRYWMALRDADRAKFLFHHVSTDEVYGDLAGSTGLFLESTPYSPSSPYSASKASSDHLVRAWHRTYGLPVVITNCSNNYGPFQFPEKLIPLTILNALAGKPIPIYGNGSQIRDWLFVEDHAIALIKVVTKGKIGETYNIGGHNEKTNLEVVETICDLLEELAPKEPSDLDKYRDLITFVLDRPGHDARYAIDASKIKRELDWIPKETFESGLRKTVQWYLDNRKWWERVLSGDYRLERLGE